MNEVYEDAINYLKYYGEKNCGKIENIAYFLNCELKNYIQLQSNWNSLRDWLELRKELYNSSIKDEYKVILDKMNELESGDNK